MPRGISTTCSWAVKAKRVVMSSALPSSETSASAAERAFRYWPVRDLRSAGIAGTPLWSRLGTPGAGPIPSTVEEGVSGAGGAAASRKARMRTGMAPRFARDLCEKQGQRMTGPETSAPHVRSDGHRSSRRFHADRSICVRFAAPRVRPAPQSPRRRPGAHHPRLRRASGAHRIDGVGKSLALALHALPAGNLTFAGGIERSVANLDLTLSLVMADDQAIWRDAGPGQLERMRRRAVGEQLFAAAKHDRHCEDAHSVDQVIGEQLVDEFGTALGDEVRAVFLLQALHVGDVAQEH